MVVTLSKRAIVIELRPSTIDIVVASVRNAVGKDA